MCAKDKRTAIAKNSLEKKIRKILWRVGNHRPHPPPPTPVSPRVEIKPIVERPPAGAPSVGAWKLNCALKQYFQLTLIQSSKRVYSNLTEIVL